MIDALEAAHPGLRTRVLDDDGKLRRFVNVYVNDDDVRFAAGLQTPTPDGAWSRSSPQSPAADGRSSDERGALSGSRAPHHVGNHARLAVTPVRAVLCGGSAVSGGGE